MKKLLLISALLIFACSSDDSTSDDNSQPSKKIESVTSPPNDCNGCEGHNSYLSYTNDKLTFVESDYYLMGFSGDEYEMGNIDETYIIEHLDGLVRITSSNFESSYIEEISVNQDGTIMSPGINFENGYLISMFGFSDGQGERYYNWENGNLTSIQEINSNGTTNTFSSTFTDYNNLADINFLLEFRHTDEFIISVLGFYGNPSAKLPLQETYVMDNGGTYQTEILDYSYLFDDEGYPIKIIVNYEGDWNGVTSSSSRTYNFTYTN